METIFGIPADFLLATLLLFLVVILAIIVYTAFRYPVPFRLGIRNLRRRKSQTALIVAGLALSTLIITSALFEKHLANPFPLARDAALEPRLSPSPLGSSSQTAAAVWSSTARV